MPFIFKNSEDELKKQQAGNISGVSNTFNIPGSNQSATAPKAEKKSGSWTNLNQYLDSNKEQAGAMADKVTGSIDSEATAASDKINTVKTSAPTAISSVTNQQIKDNYFATPDLNKKSEYQTLKTTGGYSGPTDIYGVNGFSEAETLTGKADQKLKQAQSEGGRQELLKDAYKRPTYSQGQSTLDNLLVQNDAGSKTKFNNVQNKWTGLTSMLDGTRNDVNNTIQNNITTAQANKAKFPGAEDEYVNEFLNPIKQRAADFNTAASPKINAVTSDIQDDALTADTLAQFGLAEGQNLYDTVLANYLSTDATQANANNVADANERAKYSALMNLINGTGTELTADGKAINPVKFDKDRFLVDVKSQQDAFNTEAPLTKAGQKYTYQIDPIQGVEDTFDSSTNLQDYVSGKTPDISHLPKQLQDMIRAEWKSKFDPVLNKFNYNRKISKG